MLDERGRGKEVVAEGGDRRERAAQGDDVARGAAPQGDAGGDAGDILDRLDEGDEFAGEAEVVGEEADGPLAGGDRADVAEGAAEPVAQEAAAHRCAAERSSRGCGEDADEGAVALAGGTGCLVLGADGAVDL